MRFLQGAKTFFRPKLTKNQGKTDYKKFWTEDPPIFVLFLVTLGQKMRNTNQESLKNH